MSAEEFEKLIDKIYEYYYDRFPDKEDIISLICGSINYEYKKALRKKGEHNV